MKQFLITILLSINLVNIGYSQDSTIERGVIELRRSIQKNIVISDSIISGKKSAVVLANVKLRKNGKFLSCVILYSDSNDITQAVSKVFPLISSDIWKKFKNIQNISIPLFFVYNDGENEFCLDWLDINLRKMETNYLLGLSIKPIVILFSEPKRMR